MILGFLIWRCCVTTDQKRGHRIRLGPTTALNNWYEGKSSFKLLTVDNKIYLSVSDIDFAL